MFGGLVWSKKRRRLVVGRDCAPALKPQRVISDFGWLGGEVFSAGEASPGAAALAQLQSVAGKAILSRHLPRPSWAKLRV